MSQLRLLAIFKKNRAYPTENILVNRETTELISRVMTPTTGEEGFNRNRRSDTKLLEVIFRTPVIMLPKNMIRTAEPKRPSSKSCLTLSAFFTSVSFVLLLPVQLCSGMFGQTQDTGWLMASLLLSSIAMVASTIFYLVFSQCYFLLLDFPDYTVKQLLRSSMRIMKGHKGRLFYLQVSFIPLVLLALLTCGIGMLWLTPYVQMTYTCFFLNLMNPLSEG